MKSNHHQAKHSGMAAILLTMLVAATMLAGTVVPAQAQTFTLLYTFQGANNNEGAYPQGLVQGTDGNLYGVTEAGGDNGGDDDSGTFFKISTSGNLKTLCAFNLKTCAGAQAPSANLILGTNGDFYGVDLLGHNFRITPTGKLKVLYTNANAVSVAPLVLASNGDFYGVDKLGGVNNNCGGGTTCGSVFKMAASGKLTTLYSFCSVFQNGVCLDGQNPQFALVQGADGNFYGTTGAGGSGTYGPGGTFFTVTPGGALTTLYNFCTLNQCADGSQPSNIFLATDGNFYGITWQGGVNNNSQGTIFQFTPSGTLTTLHNFDGTDGSGPGGGGTLMQDTNGTLYGTMLQGGISWPCDSGVVCVGTVFSLDMGLGPFVETLPTSGKVKAAVKILGTDLTGATSVTFNGTAATFKVASSSEITTNVPVGASTGKVQVVTPNGTLTSNVVFQVP